MRNEWRPEDPASMMDSLHDHMREIVDMERRRAELTASASVLNGAVTVTVNADGQLIDTVITDLTDVDPGALGAAITSAAKAAADDVARQSAELRDPILRDHDQLPDLSEIVPGMFDLDIMEFPLPKPGARVPTEPDVPDSSLIPVAPTVSEVRVEPDEVVPPIEIPGAEEHEVARHHARGSEVSDSGWE